MAEHDAALVEKAAEALAIHLTDAEEFETTCSDAPEPRSVHLARAVLAETADWAAGNALPGVSVEYLRDRAAQQREGNADGR